MVRLIACRLNRRSRFEEFILFCCKYFLYLDDIYGVESAIGLSVMDEYAFVDEVALFHISLKYLPTLDCHASLGKGHYARLNLKWCETCQRDFVAITAALCATYLKSLATGFRVEGKVNFVVLLDKVVSVSFRSYKNEGYRLVPQPSETAPRGGHRIERFLASGSDEHPLLADEVELVF